MNIVANEDVRGGRRFQLDEESIKNVKSREDFVCIIICPKIGYFLKILNVNCVRQECL
jgi:hypothetical protein